MSYNGKHRCLVLEYMDAGALDKRLGNTKLPTLQWRQRARIILHVARGLAYMHSLNPPVVHRDIKCGNILLTTAVDDDSDDDDDSYAGRDPGMLRTSSNANSDGLSVDLRIQANTDDGIEDREVLRTTGDAGGSSEDEDEVLLRTSSTIRDDVSTRSPMLRTPGASDDPVVKAFLTESDEGKKQDDHNSGEGKGPRLLAKISDFGTVRENREQQEGILRTSRRTHASTKHVCGTTPYMPPEYLSRWVPAACDVSLSLSHTHILSLSLPLSFLSLSLFPGF